MKSIDIRKLNDIVIDELIVHSLCQTLYSVKALIGGEYYEVKNRFRSYRSTSFGRINQDFAHAQVRKVSLIQNSAYDEMIGQPIRQSPNTLYISSHIQTKSTND